MEIKSINIEEKFSLFQEFWSPKIIAGMNNYHIKIAKIKGEFVWHNHPDTDETFLVIKGQMQLHLKDKIIQLQPGEMVVVPSGVGHMPVAPDECHILMIELAGTLNTGDTRGVRTVETPEWI